MPTPDRLGRRIGLYILDDYSALRDVNAETMAAAGWLFRARPAPMFNELNLNKRSLTLNLKTDEAKSIVRE